MFGEYADHLQPLALGFNGRTHRIGIARQFHSHVVADDGDGSPRCDLHGREIAPRCNVQRNHIIVSLRDRDNTDPIQAAVARLNGEHRLRLKDYLLGLGQSLLQERGIIQAHLPALHVFPPRVIFVKRPRPFLDEQHLIVEHIERTLQAVFEGIHHRKNSRDHEDAHHDPEQGQEGPEAVGHDGGPSESEAFKKQAKPEHGTKLIPARQVRVYVGV